MSAVFWPADSAWKKVSRDKHGWSLALGSTALRHWMGGCQVGWVPLIFLRPGEGQKTSSGRAWEPKAFHQLLEEFFFVFEGTQFFSINLSFPKFARRRKFKRRLPVRCARQDASEIGNPTVLTSRQFPFVPNFLWQTQTSCFVNLNLV